MLEKLLSLVFPPRLPGRVRDWPEPEPALTFHEQGWAGNTRRKYTGIERHWMEVEASLGPVQRRCLSGPQKKGII